MIGIIGALSVEIGYLLEMMPLYEEKTISGIRFCRGNISGTEVVVAQSGVGKVHAAICAQTMILQYSPRIIINTGVAGALSDDLSKGDVVIATSLVQHDIDNSVFGDPLGTIPNAGVIHIPCSRELIQSLRELSENSGDYKCHTGTIATGDQFICNKEKAEWIHHSFNALACEQEGGSIAQVCYINNLDFCAIRTISDNANSDSHEDYSRFLQESAQRAASLISRFIGRLKDMAQCV